MEDALASEVELPPQDPVWALHARNWEYVRSPLRPSQFYIRTYEEIVACVLDGITMPRVLLLGCTPEILLMKWPLDTRIVCLERSTAMAEKVYQPTQMYIAEGVHTRLVLGDWLQVNHYFDPESFDLVIGDGCYTQLMASDYQQLGTQLGIVMKPAAFFVHRFLVAAGRRSGPTARREEPDEVLELLKKPFCFESFSEFKLRLLISMQTSFKEGVCLGDVYEAWANFCRKNPASAIKPQHYLARERDTIENYRGSNKRYTFPNDDRVGLASAVSPLHLATVDNYRQDIRCVMTTLYKDKAALSKIKELCK